MRALSSNEVNNVAGAGYSEDIITTAATLYVGSVIGAAASSVSSAAFGAATTILGTMNAFVPCAAAIGAVGAVASPIIGIVAPVLAFEAAYPGVIAEKVGPYFK